METLGDRIKKLLKERGLSQKAAALALDMPELTFGRIIRSEVEPGYLKVMQIANLLKADLNWLITGQTLEQRQAGYKTTLPQYRHVKEKEGIYSGEDMLQLIQIIQKLTPEQRQKLLRIIQEIFDLNLEP